MLHHVKRILAAALAMLLIVGLLPADVLAVALREPVIKTEWHINPLYGDILSPEDLPSVSHIHTASVSCATYDEAVAAVRAGMVARQAAVELTIPAGADWDLNALLNEALAHTGNPKEGDSLAFQMGSWGISWGGTYLKYEFTYYTTAEMEAQVDAAVADLLQELDLDEKSDYEKFCGIYDWICANVVYDYTHLSDPSYLTQFTAYGALINGTSVCQGYAVLLYRLLLELGVDCRVIPGVANGGGHAWNIVKLGDRYYNTDSTWDAIYSQAGADYQWCLRGSDNFTDHVRDAEFNIDPFHLEYPTSPTDYDPSTHTHSYESTVTEPTCTTQGYTTYTCTLCGHSYVDNYVEATGEHTYENGICTICSRVSEDEEKMLRILLIGNSFSWDAADCGYGLQDSQMYDLIKNLLASGYDVHVGVLVKGSTTLGYHATSAMNGTAEYKYAEIGPDTGYQWSPSNGGTETNAMADILDLYLWDVIVLQPYQHEAEGSTTPTNSAYVGGDAQFDSVYDSIPYLLDYFGEEEPNAEIYYYMPWSTTKYYGEEGTKDGFARIAAFTQNQVMSFYGPNTGNHFAGIIQVGTAIENARATYLDRLRFGEGDGGARPDLDIQIGLQRDNQHLSFGIGRYIAGFMFAEALVPLEMRKDTYDYPTVKDSPVIGQLPQQYSEIALRACLDAYYHPYEITSYWDYSMDPAESVDCNLRYDEYNFTEIQDGDELLETLKLTVAHYFAKEGFYLYDITLLSYNIDSEGTVLDFEADVSFSYGYSFRKTTIVKHTHVYEVTIVPPDCYNAGYTKHTCTVCGEYYCDEYVDALGHDFVSEVVDPTCEKQGYTRQTCQRCNGIKFTDYTDPLGHDYQETVTPPTCTSQGYTTHTCSRCSDSYQSDFKAKTEHTYVPSVVAPTCTAEGYTVYTCSGCGKNYTSDYTPSLGHTWDEGVVTKEPTEEEEGIRLHTCITCSATEERSIPKLDHVHNFEAVVTEPTCLTDGYTTYTCRCGASYKDDYVSALGHDYVDTVTPPTCTEGGYTHSVCSRCGTDKKHTFTDPTGHTWGEWFLAQAPTCSVPGYEQRNCQNCDAIDVKTIAVTEHDYVAVVTDPTCWDEGYTTHTCANCGHSYTDQYVPANGHDFEWVTILMPTCQEEGFGYYICKTCSYSKKEAIPVTDHYYDSLVTEPTCTEGGYTTFTCIYCSDSYTANPTNPVPHDWGEWYVVTEGSCTVDHVEQHDCTLCGKSETLVSKAIGHNYTSEVTDPTCEDQGFLTHTCTACGDSYKDNYTDALGHLYEDVVTREPTEDAEGERTYTCSRCGDSYTEAIPKLDHVHEYESVVTEPTCDTEGYTTHTCKCGHSYKDSYTNALGHLYEDVVTKEPTEEAEGERTYTCSRCGDTYTEAIPKLDHVHEYESVVTEPTCETDGYTTYTCKCGDSYVSDWVKAKGHNWGEWYTVTEVTCETDGVNRHDCIDCGDYETCYIMATGHNYTAEVVEPGCETEGYTLHTCANCNHSYKDTFVAATGHNYDAVVTDPTCDNQGYTTHTCENCGNSYTDSYTDALGHSGDGDVCDKCGQPIFDLGDANGDGKVNNVDAMIILQFAVGFIDETQLNKSLCDVDGNGKINNVDAMLILQFAVGFIDKFPIE